jgi:dTDP-4-amino-4,6-dideoxygalactose transaminase
VYHLYVVRAPEGERDRFREELSDRGVATGIHYPVPVHLQEASREIGRVAGDLRVTETSTQRILSLPMYPELGPQQLSYVATCLEAVRRTHAAYA